MVQKVFNSHEAGRIFLTYVYSSAVNLDIAACYDKPVALPKKKKEYGDFWVCRNFNENVNS